MDFSFFFGPNKTHFVFYENGMVEAGSTMPFHGIVSRGLFNKLRENNVPNEVWYNNAHLLEREDLNSDSNVQDLLMLKEYAAECKVLSFSESAACAKLYIENYFDGLKAKNIAKCEIWNIKEGHISSVWKVSFFDSSSKENHFIINVARDYEAGIELKITSENMKAIAEHYPYINMAKVYDIRKILLNYNDNPYEVVATRNEWIEDTYEIHMVKDKLNGKEQYLLVERFLTKEGSPAHISSIYGRRFSEEESAKIKDDIDLFLNNASKCLSHTPNLNINDGDVVWDGENTVVIAIH